MLERTIEDHTEPENDFHVKIYDGFFLLQSLVNVPQTYRQIAELLLKIITDHNDDTQIYLLLDIYKPDSIKDCQRAKRENYTADFSIRGKILFHS